MLRRVHRLQEANGRSSVGSLKPTTDLDPEFCKRDKFDRPKFFRGKSFEDGKLNVLKRGKSLMGEQFMQSPKASHDRTMFRDLLTEEEEDYRAAHPELFDPKLMHEKYLEQVMERQRTELLAVSISERCSDATCCSLVIGCVS